MSSLGIKQALIAQHTQDNICLSLTPLRFQVRQFGINKHLEAVPVMEIIWD
jgi:hypothetical protein